MVLRMDRSRPRVHAIAYGTKAEECARSPSHRARSLESKEALGDGQILARTASSTISEPVSNAAPRRGILIALLISLSFLAIALAISLYAHTTFAVPRSGNIPGLHINFWIPPIAAAAGYLLLQGTTRHLGRMRATWYTIAQRAAGDYLLLGLFILVVYIHFNIKMWIPVINPRLYDQDYFAVDQAAGSVLVLFGNLRALLARILPDADLWYQAAFFAVFVLSFLCHGLGSRRYHYHNMTALLLIESVGPLTYLIAPAIGPFIYQHGMSSLATAAELRMYGVYEMARAGGAAWIAAQGGKFFADPLAAMPSLHVGASFIIAYYAVRARLWVAPLTILAFCWIVIESVAARWHYLVDLPAGLLVAFAVIAVTNRVYSLRPSKNRDPKGPPAERPSGRDASTTAAADLHAGMVQAEGERQPTVWVLKCHRVGDHAQSMALARALGWPFVLKETRFHWYELFFALASSTTLAGLNRRRSSPLAPPWPDLVIVGGRPNETPAKWIRKQSGGRTRIVVIGRYWTPPNELDFVVTTPQFRLPENDNVLHNSFPLHSVTKATLAEARTTWASRLAGTHPPYVTLLVGGSSGPYVFSRESASRLGREASALAQSVNATLLVSTSARTKGHAMKALKSAISVPCLFHRWREDDPDNPYLGFLALADAVIVTGDSMSMLAEACSTGRPVYIFEFGGGPAAMHGPRSRHAKVRQWWRWSQLKDQGILGLPYAFAIGLPAWRLNRSRDIRLVQNRFIASGRAKWLHNGAVVPPSSVPTDDLQRAVACIVKLMSAKKGCTDTLAGGAERALADATHVRAALAYSASSARHCTSRPP